MQVYRNFVGATLVCVLLGSPDEVAAQFATPDAAVRALYGLYKTQSGPGFPSDQAGVKRFLEPVLARAWIKDSGGASEGKQFLGSDPFIQGQDWDLSRLTIEPSNTAGDRAMVQVSFRNFNEPRRMVYRLKREADGWRIYDVAGGGSQGLRRDLGLKD